MLASCTEPNASGGARLRDGGGGLDAGEASDAEVAGDGAASNQEDAATLGNKGRVVSLTPGYALADEEYHYRPKVNLPEQASWQIEKGPRGAHVSADGAEISWTPAADQKGRNELSISTKLGARLLTQDAEITVGVAEEQAALDVDEKAIGSLIVTAPKSLVRGAGVTVRPATLKSATRLSIAELSSAPPMAMAKGTPRAVHFGPAGTVFAEPAVITLPLSDEDAIDKARVGAFVYDDKGHWLRVPVVAIDTEKRLVHARAAHFSLYAAAQSKLTLSVSARTAASASACVGSAIADVTLDEQLSAIDGSQIGDLPAALAALVEGLPGGLSSLLASPGVSGSFRFVRVVELAQAAGAERVVLETRLLVSTLYLPGDGSATITHTDALGNMLGVFPVLDIASAGSSLWQHLSGRATRAVFSALPSGGGSVAARMHALYVPGDASLDPISADDLGFAMVDYVPADASLLASETSDKDLDCDGLLKAFDGIDDRLVGRIVTVPDGVVGAVAGANVRLSATLEHAPADSVLVWKVLSGTAALHAVEGAASARDFVAELPGRYLVGVSAELEGEPLEQVFAIDVSAAAELPSCTPSPVRGIVKQDSSIALAAVLSESGLPESAREVEWGLQVDETFSASPELVARGNEASFRPSQPGRYRVACRTRQGVRSGTPGSVLLDVVPPQQNLTPTDLTLSPSAATLLAGEVLALTATGKDPEGQALRFGWTVNGGALQVQSDTRASSRNSFSATTPGLYELRVTVRDQEENPQEVSASILVVGKAEDVSGVDADRDGWPSGLDCDDGDARVHPGAVDKCGDTIDDDCSGTARASDCDGDGYTSEQGDCLDQRREVHPGAVELCDGVDNDCDGSVDQSFRIGTSCSVGTGACTASAQWVCGSDGFSAVCPATSHKGGLELCDGVDNDCDGSIDEDFVPAVTHCGQGACAASGVTSCVQGVEQDSCRALSASVSDATCNGVDDDCNGQIDEDFVRLTEVCNGLDDDCDQQTDDGLICQASSGACSPVGAELCNGLDDDCDGFFDEGGICAAAPVADSLLGVLWECGDSACSVLSNGGFMFREGGKALKLHTFDNGAYEPQDGPYCIEEPFTYSLSNGVLTVSYRDGDNLPQTAVGTLSVAGSRATVVWTSAPADLLGTMELVRVPEQPGGACPRGPVCQPELCGNGFDDDCDGFQDALDSDCSAQCGATSSPELCDLLDNDCNGLVDDLKQPCNRPDALGICRNGHMVCSAGGSTTSCQPGVPELLELCADGLDNDCDGSTDEAGCSALSPAESCFNALDVTGGGVFELAKGERDDLEGGCRPSGYVDRVFYINTPAALSLQYSLLLNGSVGLDLGAVLYKAPAGFVAGQSCPSFDPKDAMCLGSGQRAMLYLDPASTYLLVVEAAPDRVVSGGTFRLSVGQSMDGVCLPSDGDGDGIAICAGDCNDTQPSVHPGAGELCNQQDDDCDGLVDEQDGTCQTGLPGVCATGVSVCGQTPACQPLQRSAVDFCGDGVDNDCNGATDDACVDNPGESCSNAIDVGLGGAFSGTLATASDDAVSRCSAGVGAERFYRITVPAGGQYVTLGRSSYPGSMRYSLYRDCTLEPVACDFKGGLLEQGSYRLAVEAEGAGQPYTFTIGLGDATNCATPDSDGDGVTACAGDCDESSATVHSGASESAGCDAIDNDCNGAIDDLHTSCVVAGQTGVCADGQLYCGPNGSSMCQQTGRPDPQGRDYCGDGLDNDCDGAADSQDAQLCVSLPAGDVCSLAQQADITGGGTFQGSLAGYGDDTQLGCGDNGSSAVERFYSFSLSQPRVVSVELRPTGAGSDTSFLGMQLLTSCTAQMSGFCGANFISAELPIGTYSLAVFGSSSRAYSLSFASRAPGDTTGTSCLPADSDADGSTLCTGDCREGDATSHPGAAELCDGRDNDCNGQVDDKLPSSGCTIAGGVGECAQGRTSCSQGVPSCVGPTPGQNQEICGDGRDNDCDGMADDQGVPGSDCILPGGETCQSPQAINANGFFQGNLEGATHDGNGCYGGVNGTAAERYYSFMVPQPGYYYLQLVPEGTGAAPGHAVGISSGSCASGPAIVGCNASGTNVVYYYLPTSGVHYVVVESDAPFAYRVGLAASDGAGNCSAPDFDGDGSTLCTYDCNEQSGAVHPGAPELCNGSDDNCDGRVDEGC